MPVFETADELYACIGGLFERMKSQTQVQTGLASLELTVRFNYTQPEASITILAYDGEGAIHYGECNKKPDVELAMTGDIAHHFWLGEINVMGAITKRQIVPTGTLSKIMALAPLIKAGIQIYPQHYQECLGKDK
jgi:hypothetical protein